MKELAEAMEKLGGGVGQNSGRRLRVAKNASRAFNIFSLEQEEVLTELKNTKVQDPSTSTLDRDKES